MQKYVWLIHEVLCTCKESFGPRDIYYSLYCILMTEISLARLPTNNTVIKCALL